MSREVKNDSMIDGSSCRRVSRTAYGRVAALLAAAGLVDLTGACSIGPDPGSIAAEASDYTNFPTQPSQSTTAAPTSETPTTPPETTSAEASPTSTSPVPTSQSSASPSPEPSPAVHFVVHPDQSRVYSTDTYKTFNGYAANVFQAPDATSTPLNDPNADTLAQPHMAYSGNAASTITAFCFERGVVVPTTNGGEGRYARVDIAPFVSAGAMQATPDNTGLMSFAELAGEGLLRLESC